MVLPAVPTCIEEKFTPKITGLRSIIRTKTDGSIFFLTNLGYWVMNKSFDTGEEEIWGPISYSTFCALNPIEISTFFVIKPTLEQHVYFFYTSKNIIFIEFGDSEILLPQSRHGQEIDERTSSRSIYSVKEISPQLIAVGYKNTESINLFKMGVL